MAQGFGTSRFGKNTGYENYKLKEGSNIFRILPAMKSGADKGIWTRYLSTHYGYKGVDQRDPTKTRAKPFACLEEKNTKTKMIVVECPECTNRANKKATLENLEAQVQTGALKPEEVAAQLAPLKEWLQEHNCDRKWTMNVKSPDGKFGILRIPHRAKLVLDTAILKLQKEGYDNVTALEGGVWLDFHRTGMDTNSVYAVGPVEEVVTEGGRKLKMIKTDTLSESEQVQALETCPDLLEVVRRVSFEQARALVEGTGDPHEVDAILGISQSHVREESPPVIPVTRAPAATPVSKPAAQTVAPVAAAPVVEDDEDAEIQALLAKKAARLNKAAEVKTAPATQAKAVAPAPKAAVTTGESGMSDEDFLRQFGG